MGGDLDIIGCAEEEDDSADLHWAEYELYLQKEWEEEEKRENERRQHNVEPL